MAAERNVNWVVKRNMDYLLEEIAAGDIEVASVIELSEASGRVAAGLFMTEG